MSEENTDQPKQQDAEQNEAEMLKRKSAELEETIAQLKDQLLRKAAEFENYKKRTENEYASLVKYANEDLISNLLPVIDDFHRSVKMGQTASGDKNSPDPQSADALLRGNELIYNKFMKILEGIGVTAFDSVGMPFDPNFHDALLQVPRNDVAPHTVVEEVEKGYKLNDKVIRHAKVIVSGEISAEEQPGSNPDSDTQNEMKVS